MKRKAFLLRMDPALYEAIERLAQQELRSVNSQIEFLLRQSLHSRGRRVPDPDEPGDSQAAEPDEAP